MSRIQSDFRLQGLCWSSAGRTVGVRWPAAAVPIATCLVAPENALANSAVDAAFHPNLLLYGGFIALVFLSLGVLISRRAFCNRRMAAAVAQWPTTAGTVISADVTKRIHGAEISHYYFLPQVRYEYEANGVHCQGDIIRIGLDDLGYLKEKNARDHIALYPVGTAIAVHYDPQDPKHAALEIGQVGVNRMMLVGAIFAGLGIAMLLISIGSVSLPSN
jgi:hypothetical protein